MCNKQIKCRNIQSLFLTNEQQCEHRFKMQNKHCCFSLKQTYQTLTSTHLHVIVAGFPEAWQSPNAESTIVIDCFQLVANQFLLATECYKYDHLAKSMLQLEACNQKHTLMCLTQFQQKSDQTCTKIKLLSLQSLKCLGPALCKSPHGSASQMVKKWSHNTTHW